MVTGVPPRVDRDAVRRRMAPLVAALVDDLVEILIDELAARAASAPPYARDALAVFAGQYQLTKREQEVFTAVILLGGTNSQIAEDLCIVPKTVESHLSNIYQKCGVPRKAELLQLAGRSGLDFGGNPCETNRLTSVMAGSSNANAAVATGQWSPSGDEAAWTASSAMPGPAAGRRRGGRPIRSASRFPR